MRIKKSITLDQSTFELINKTAEAKNLKFSQALDFRIKRSNDLYEFYHSIQDILLDDKYDDKMSLALISTIVKNFQSRID